jgi:hypothetical protein
MGGKDSDAPLQQVAVVCVHGINMADPNYFEPFEASVMNALPRHLRPNVSFRSVFWADIVRGRQKDYLKDAAVFSGLQSSALRTFVIQGLGDAAAYQKTRNRINSAYYEIQASLSWTLDALNSNAFPNRLLVLVGHSLGCHILSSYIWDMTRLKRYGDERLASEHEDIQREAKLLQSPETSAFRRLDTLAGLITLGSNMPLFTFNFGPPNVFPICHRLEGKLEPGFPGKALQGEVLDRTRWLNFYSQNDPLGYPLKSLNHLYRNEQRLRDFEVYSEGWPRALCLRGRLRALNALPAHSGYCTNSTVIRESKRLIQALILAKSVPSEKPAGGAPDLEKSQAVASA